MPPFRLRPDVASAPPAPAGPVRVLLATAGWPSGILDIGSWAARLASVEVAIVQISSDRNGSFIEKLRSWRPHVVGFRVEGEPFEPILDWIGTVRALLPAEVVLGGPTATGHPIELLEWSGADYVFAGEAEESFAQFLQLARRPDSRDLLPQIAGIAYRYGGRTYHNTLPTDGYGRSVLEAGPADHTASITSRPDAVRPIVSQEILAANRLDWSLLEGFGQPFDSLFFTGGRGCPGACTFCAKLHGPQVRVKSASQLLEEIEQADACVAQGRLRLTRWPLFAHVRDDRLRSGQVSWAAIYDEDFFLHIPRALEFFDLWSRSPLSGRYRLSLQTNPCSLLKTGTEVLSRLRAASSSAASHKLDRSPFSIHPELLDWIDRLKPMVQLGAESFNPALLARWRKRHNLAQLNCVLDALDATGQDYTVFQLLTDFDTTGEELIETLRLLILAALAHPRMRIASSPYTIPLYHSDTRKSLEFSGRLQPKGTGGMCERNDQAALCSDGRKGPPHPCVSHRSSRPAWIHDFRDYERPHPEWMDPLAARLADLADERLQWALDPRTRSGALAETMPRIVAHLQDLSSGDHPSRDALLSQARAAADQIAAAKFQLPR